jgi:phospholipase C
MMNVDRRALMQLGLGAGAIAALPPAIARALALPAAVETGSIKDVQHVVILMQENRSFDHYFGTLPGVRGFNDRLPIPIGDKGEKPRPVWNQRLKSDAGIGKLSPYHLDTSAVFDIMRMEGTPHGWPDSQDAWDHGRIAAWPEHKTHRSMGYFKRSDIPFQFALAETFTICDAYHCSIMSSTNPNRMFLWAGTNDPQGRHGGPIVDNSHDSFPSKGYAEPAYTLTSYAERLQQAGVDWRIYKYMDDYFTNNPLVGIESYRASHLKTAGSDPELAKRAMTTYGLDRLRADVMDGSLPQVSYLIAPARGSEHPSRSSPAQGADYISDVLDALTSNPAVWAKTALFIMFDENDGFFDHVPPPAPPSRDDSNPERLHGASTVDLAGEYHVRPGTGDANTKLARLMNRPYGLGARVPMFVVSPWSRGGVVNSEVFDHTSVIRFLETRFGVSEPNITPWRRAVCGDLTSAFNFKNPNNSPFMQGLPDPSAIAKRVDLIESRIDPKPPVDNPQAVQETGVRPSSPLPYDLEAQPYVEASTNRVLVNFRNVGKAGAVFHVYDRLHLDRAPHRYTVEAGKSLHGIWDAAADDGRFDLWILGPNGFHRHYAGEVAQADLINRLFWQNQGDQLTIKAPAGVEVGSAYAKHKAWTATGRQPGQTWLATETSGWYDFTLTHPDHSGLQVRLAGRLENGQLRSTDPAF